MGTICYTRLKFGFELIVVLLFATLCVSIAKISSPNETWLDPIDSNLTNLWQIDVNYNSFEVYPITFLYSTIGQASLIYYSSINGTNVTNFQWSIDSERTIIK